MCNFDFTPLFDSTFATYIFVYNPTIAIRHIQQIVNYEVHLTGVLEDPLVLTIRSLLLLVLRACRHKRMWNPCLKASYLYRIIGVCP
jgi:hypothetical protein